MQKCLNEALKAGEFQLFPVVRQNGQYVHEGLPFHIVKELQKAVQLHGLHSLFTIGVLETICGMYSMCAWDWGSLMKIILTPPQYAVCAQEFHDAFVTPALQNFEAAIPVTSEQLSGMGQYVQPRQQAQFPIIVREQRTDIV